MVYTIFFKVKCSKHDDGENANRFNFVTCQVQFSHVTTCNSPAMSRRPAAGVPSPALPRAVTAARSSGQAARGSPHIRRKFAVNGSTKCSGDVADYQVNFKKMLRKSALLDK
jgi:hypothetical protein